LGYLVECLTEKRAAGPLLLDTAPLLEEEWYVVLSTLMENRGDPRLKHRTGSMSALAAHDDPVDAIERDGAEILQ